MCGIVGIVNREAPQDSRILSAALDTMKLRGSDDCGMWQYENVSLGHRRLSIVGVRHGHQPVSSPDGRIIIVVNGEFYDFERLRQNLSSTYTFQTDSDSEVLIPLYLKYGYIGMMEHLRGEFAFCMTRKTICSWPEETVSASSLCAGMMMARD